MHNFEQDSDIVASASFLKADWCPKMGDAEACLDDANTVTPSKQNQKGGLRTMPFIIGNEACERLASFGIAPNMIKYLQGGYHMDVATGTTVLSLWSAATNFLPLVGAFASDSYFGRFRTILLGSLASFLGMVLLWLTAMIPQVKPPTCNPSSQICKSAAPSQLTLLYASFMLMSIGAGGTRSSSMAFGADQLIKEGNHNNKRVVQSFFNWYYASTIVAIMTAMTVIVYIQDHLGWKVGFGIPAILMFMSAFLFMLASPFYVKAKPNKSLFVGFAQVAVAAFKNRHIALPKNIKEGSYSQTFGSKVLVPTERLRFLNRACIVQNHDTRLTPDGPASQPKGLCTVDQVEELKALISVIPLWSAGISIAINISQPTFPLLQASSMDRHLTSNFQIPAGSFGLFSILSLMIGLVIYDRILAPWLAKFTGNPCGLGVLQRMGIGLVLSCMAMALSAIVEGIRRKTAIRQGFAENPQGVLDMSAMWLVPQYCFSGLAEAFNAIGQYEFYYTHFPKSMSSIGTTLFGLSMAVGNLLVGAIVNLVDNATKKGGNESWVSSNLNKGHYDYYYWILTVISGINFLYFLVCCWAYGPVEGERNKSQNEGEGEGEGEAVKEEETCESKENCKGAVQAD